MSIVVLQYYMLLYIHENSAYSLPYMGRSCRYVSILHFDLCYIALSSRVSFSANSRRACGLCLRNSNVYFGCATNVPGRYCMTWGHEKENIRSNACQNGLFLSKIWLKLRNMSIIWIYMIIVSSHLFNDLFLCASQIHSVRPGCPAVCAWANK